MRRRLLIGNWKMHGDGTSLPAIAAIAARAAAAREVEVALCLPATLIHRAAATCPSLVIGGQDCHHEAHGAHTGEVAPAMLGEAGAQLVILGHSERRAAGEIDAQVAAKVRAALAAGLRVVICVGETLAERRDGRALAVVSDQLRHSIVGAARDGLVVAYEPVWAIGSGITPMPAEIATVADTIAAQVPGVPIVYGGSVTPERCGALIAEAGVDGFLVGGASLSPASFGAMITALDVSGEEQRSNIE